VPQPLAVPEPSGGGGFDIGIEEVLGGTGAAFTAGAVGKFVSNLGQAGGGGAASVAALPSLLAAQSARESQRKSEAEQGFLEKMFADAFSGSGGGGGGSGAPMMMLGSNFGSMLPTESADPTDRGRERSTQPVSFEHSPTYNLESLQQLQRQQRQDKRELEKKIENLRQSFQP